MCSGWLFSGGAGTWRSSDESVFIKPSYGNDNTFSSISCAVDVTARAFSSTSVFFIPHLKRSRKPLICLSMASNGPPGFSSLWDLRTKVPAPFIFFFSQCGKSFYFCMCEFNSGFNILEPWRGLWHGGRQRASAGLLHRPKPQSSAKSRYEKW